MEPIENDLAETPASTAEEESTLSLYFRDLTTSSRPMSADQERRLAVEIAGAHAAIWTELLSSRRLAAPLLERALRDRPRDRDLRALRRAAGKRQAELARLAAKAAPRLWERDRDRLLLDELLAEAEGEARGRARLAEPIRRIRLARARAERARHEFARRNLRLVVVVARAFLHSGMSFGDLIQEGNLGLLKAVDRFDVARGFRFSTYAGWWIKHAIRNAVAHGGRLVRLPAHRIEAGRRLSGARHRLAGRLGRLPTAPELAHASGLTLRRVEAGLRPLLAHPTSLDRPIHHEGRALSDTLADQDAEERAAPRLLAERETRKQLGEALGRLEPMEASIVRGRFGFDDEQEEARSLADIGREHGLSRERIRQIEARALGKMRRWLELAEALPGAPARSVRAMARAAPAPRSEARGRASRGSAAPRPARR